MPPGSDVEVRPHFGQGELAFNRAESVFINCPFDDDFTATFDAILFAIVCCGFMPRSALESGNVADSRMQRIAQAIFSSKYSIHDLSRCRGEGDEQLARFNMPLELGISMACRYLDRQQDGRHDWLVLVPEGHQYVRFVSDLAGFDPMRYDSQPESAVTKVMIWLATRPDAVQIPTPKQVLSALPDFRSAKQRLAEDWGDEIPWADWILAAQAARPR